MFNKEQQNHMNWVCSLPYNERCYCGWFHFGGCVNCDYSNPDKTYDDNPKAHKPKDGKG